MRRHDCNIMQSHQRGTRRHSTLRDDDVAADLAAAGWTHPHDHADSIQPGWTIHPQLLARQDVEAIQEETGPTGYASMSARDPTSLIPPGFEPVAAEKPHARVIWDCAFGSDSSYFVTAARDKQVKVWKKGAEAGDKWELAATVKAAEAATAVGIIRDEEHQR